MPKEKKSIPNQQNNHLNEQKDNIELLINL